MIDTILNALDPSQAGVAVKALLDLTVKSLVLLSLAGVVTGLMRRTSASQRHAVWLAAIGCVVLLPVLSTILPQWRVIPVSDSIAWAPAPTAQEAAIAPVVGAEAAPMAASPVTSEVAPQAVPAAPALPEAASSDVAAAPNPAAQPNALLATFTKLAQSAANLHWTEWLFLVWLAGALLVMGHFFLGAVGLFMIARRATVVQEQEWVDLVDEIGDRLFITRPVQLLRSHATTMPVTWGGMRPVILLPADANGWDEDRRRYVLTHEMAHIKRWDCSTQGVAQLACAVYWFNPLLWVAAKRLRVERERACDDEVIAAGGRPSTYAEHLFEIARTLKATFASPLGAVAMARPSQLEGRVLAILDPQRPRSSSSRRTLAMTLIAGLLITLPLAAMSPASVESALAQEPTSPTPEINSKAADLSTSTTLADKITPKDVEPSWEPEPMVEPLADFAPAVASARPDTLDKKKRALVVSTFIDALQDSDEQVRRHAAQQLGELGDERAAKPLAEAAQNDTSVNVRRAALWALAEMDDEAAIPMLLSQLNSETDPQLRRQLVWMIGESDDESDEAGRAVMSVLSDEEPEVRAAACQVLGDMEYVPAMDALIGLIQDDSERVRKAAVWAVMEIAEEADSDKAIGALSAAIRDGSSDVRAAAAHALGEYESESSVDVLMSSLSDEDEEVRSAAAWALGEIESDRAIDALATAVSDESGEVRRMAVWALAEIENPAAARALVAGIDDPNPEVRRMIAYALGEIEAPDTFDAILSLSEDDHVEVRRAAIVALAELEDPRAIPALAQALRDGSDETRRMAAWGLSEFDDSPAAANALMAGVDDEQAEVRKAVAHGLAELEVRESIPALIKLTSDEESEVRRAAIWALGEMEDERSVDALMRVLASDDDAENRRYAAYALGEIGSMQAVEALREAMKDDSPEVRRAAAGALGDLDWDDEGDSDYDSSNDSDGGLDGYRGDSRLKIDLDGPRGQVQAELSTVGLALASSAIDVVGTAIGIAADVASEIDLGARVADITRSVLESDVVEDAIHEAALEIENMDEEISESMTVGLIESLVDIVEGRPGSPESAAALRALREMKDPRAREAARRLE